MRFQAAMELVGGEFAEVVRYSKKSWLPAKKIVEQALATRHQVCCLADSMYVYVHNVASSVGSSSSYL